MEIRLKRFSKDVDESFIMLWYVKEGDVVKKGDVLAEVETEKSISEVEAETSGIVTKILAPRGENIRVGEVLLTMDPLSEEVEQGDGEKHDRHQAEHRSRKNSRSHVRITPKLRRLARSLGVEVQDVDGTGKDKQITEEDIHREVRKRKNNPAGGVPLTGIRRRIAKRMTESLQVSAQVTITGWADVTQLEKSQVDSSAAYSWMALTSRAAAMALRNHPELNVHMKDELITPYSDIHLGIAVDTEAGLQVAVVHHADQLAIEELDKQIENLAEKARDRSLAIEEATGSTFSLTSLGGYPVEFFTPIINPPEAAILGIGRIDTHLVMEEGNVREQRRLPLSLTFDHRALDGAQAASFLEEIIRLFSQPEKIIAASPE